MRSPLFAALTCVLAAIFAVSAPAADVSVDRMELGTHVFGERLTVEDLQGRLVLVYFWDMG